MTNYLELARAAAVDAHGTLAVGEYSRTVQENQDGVLTYLFASKLKGYPDWQIAVTLFIDGWDATVSEVVLTPGETSLVAPKWVPWSERLADYKALQAALEAEAAAAAALEAEEADDADDADDEDADADSAESEAEASAEVAEETAQAESAGTESARTESAIADVPESPEAQDDADTAGGKGKGLFKWKTIRGNKKRK